MFLKLFGGWKKVKAVGGAQCFLFGFDLLKTQITHHHRYFIVGVSAGATDCAYSTCTLAIKTDTLLQEKMAVHNSLGMRKEYKHQHKIDNN